MHWTEKWKELMDKNYTEEGGWDDQAITFDFNEFVKQKVKQLEEDFKLFSSVGCDYNKFLELKTEEDKHG